MNAHHEAAHAFTMSVIHGEWGEALLEAGSPGGLELVEASHGSSNYNEHWYAVRDADGAEWLLYREQDGEDAFEVGAPRVELRFS